MQQVLLVSLVVGAVSLVVGETDSPSHLKPFGWGNAKPLEEVQGFIPVKQFFEGELMRFLIPLFFVLHNTCNCIVCMSRELNL